MKTSNLSAPGKKRLPGKLNAFTQWPTFVRVLFSLIVIGGTAIGCGWFGPADSVRFNDFLKGHDFFRLPPLPKAINPATNKPVRWSDSLSEADFDQTAEGKTEEYKAQVERAWRKAAAAEQADDWKKMRQRLRDYLNLTAGSRGSSSNRNSAIDRLDALQSLDQGASEKGLRAYLAARNAYERAFESELWPDGHQPWLTSDSAWVLLTTAAPEKALRDNFAYLRAAVLYREGKLAEAAQAFNHLAAVYPQSEKREAALFMAAALTMKQSNSFTETGSGTDYYNPDSQPTDLSARRDEAWKTAQQAFQRQLREYPRGRYQSDARGWMAYLHRQVGDRASALVEYYRMLANEQDLSGRLEAAFSLTFIRPGATAEEMDRVEATLADEPAAALAYAYHNLYNHAYSVEPTWWVFSDDKEEKERRAVSRDERRRIISFATRLMRRYPQRSLSGAFALRTAQGNLELGEYKAALDFAARALSFGLTGQDRLQALWIKGAAERYLRDYPAARRSLTVLISEDATGKLTEGARRTLAIVAEESGDLSAALEQYLALDYRYDVGYFVDVLMTPEQLADFIERHPKHEKRDELLYALGVRYLREHRWNDVRATLAQVKTTPGQSVSEYGNYVTKTYPINPKVPWQTDTETPGVREEWVLRDLQTADELEARERAVEMAPDDETKAETMYQRAGWLYQYSTLLFYNPKAWGGYRHSLMERLDDERYLAPNEAYILWEYSQKHEPAAQALTIFLEIVQRYPKTRAARDALFTAAVCHERLADYNSYWRGMYQIGLHAGERVVTVRDVKRAYPDFRLPRTRLGWEPATRTINGGPAWDPLPKPKLRPAFSTRVKIKITRLWESGRQWTVSAWQETVWPTLVNVLYAVCLMIGAYLVFVVVVLYRQQRSASSSDELISLNLQTGAAEAKEGSPVERIISQP